MMLLAYKLQHLVWWYCYAKTVRIVWLLLPMKVLTPGPRGCQPRVVSNVVRMLRDILGRFHAGHPDAQ